MQIHLPSNQPLYDWQKIVGASREDIIHRIMQGGWLDGVNHPSLNVEEIKQYGDALIRSPSLCFETELPADGDRVEVFLFFNYPGEAKSIRIDSFNLGEYKYQGRGDKFLKNLISIALDLDYDHLSMSATWDGSSYWPSRGGLIKPWPREFAQVKVLDKNFSAILDGNGYIGWHKKDVDEAYRIWREKDNEGLNKFLARDDLLVRDGNSAVPLRRLLADGVDFDDCLIDLTHPWTQSCILKRLGLNIGEERAARCLARPISTRRFKGDEPAF